MKVVHINHSYSKGGAAQAMLRLNSALNNAGVDSVVCSRTGGGDQLRAVVPQREAASVRICGEIQSRVINQNRTTISDTIFTLCGPSCDLRSLDAIKEADVINLHWINYFLSPSDVKYLHSMGKPIVWTLHDEWAYTGGCHYRSGCMNFVDNCSRCPQLDPCGWSIPEAVLAHKKEAWKDVPFSIVGPSQWIVDQAQASGIFTASKFYNIPNSIDTDTFHPRSIKDVREQMGLPENTFVILFGADVVAERRKGFDIFKAAIDSLASDGSLQGNKLHLLCFGDLGDEHRFPVPFKNLGYLNSASEIAMAYQASDLFVLPSLEDNLPNTMLESMACGTPVLGFDTGGIGEIVLDGVNGYLVVERSSHALAARIRDAIDAHATSSKLRVAARETVNEKCRHEVQASCYLALYESVVGAAKETENVIFAPPDNVVWVSGLDQVLIGNSRLNDVTNDIGRLDDVRAVRERYEHSTVCDFEQITLLGGFKEIEGPYPEYNLPEFIWCYAPRADISIRSIKTKEACLVLRLQSPLEGILTVENNIRVFSEHHFQPNFANKESSFSEFRVPIALNEGENYARFIFRGNFKDQTEIAIFSHIYIQ